MYTQEQLTEANLSWRSLFGRGEKDLQEGTLKGFGWTRERYTQEWLRGVYGK
jgi:hypothetical protein